MKKNPIIYILFVFFMLILSACNDSYNTQKSVQNKEILEALKKNSEYNKYIIAYKNKIFDQVAIDKIYSVISIDIIGKALDGNTVGVGDIMKSENDLEKLQKISQEFGIPIENICGLVYDYQLFSLLDASSVIDN